MVGFKIVQGKDRLKREYLYVKDDDKNIVPKKVYQIIPTFNSEDYLEYLLKSTQKQVDKVFAIDNMSTDRTLLILKDCNVTYKQTRVKGDMSKLVNKALRQCPKDGWVLRTDSDQVMFDKQDGYLGRYAAFLESQNILCSDVRHVEIIYNYGTVMGIDWGDGPGILWTGRRLFKYTGKEKFVGMWHENISNVKRGETTGPNNEHTGLWKGHVVKTHELVFFHYGKCMSIEKWRKKTHAILDPEAGARGLLPTIPYYGQHPSPLGIK